MTTSNENHNPPSLRKRSYLPTDSGHKRNSKHKVRKGPLGLKESLLQNITPEPHNTHECDVGMQLHAPLSSQSPVDSHVKLLEETRLPISPPPEEEIRIKELIAHAHPIKESHSRLPALSSSGASTVSSPSLSFAHVQQQTKGPSCNISSRGPDCTASTPIRILTKSVSNPRKRARSVTCTRQGSLIKRRPRAGRSATPEVLYEPPTEQFTPPRDVIMQIPSSAVSSRSRKPDALTSTGVKLSVDTKLVRIKTERLTSPFPLPPLDFSKPVPPPSPTDDPLLLVGPPAIVRRSATPDAIATKSHVDASVRIEDVFQDERTTSVCVSPTTPHHMDQSICNFGRVIMDRSSLMGVAFDDPSTFDAAFDSENSDCDVDNDVTRDRPHAAPDPFISPNHSTGSHIFHSDDESAISGEDEGEYTGRFRFYSVPVEKDPPSSATRARRESWGRPISPFPFSKRHGQTSSKARSSRPVSPAPSIFPEHPVIPLPRSHADQATDHYVRLHHEPREKLLEFGNDLNGDDFSDEDSRPTGVVEVSSDDPKAAARAAAILKLHHSYIVDGIVAQRARRRSHSFRQSFVPSQLKSPFQSVSPVLESPGDSIAPSPHRTLERSTEVSLNQDNDVKTWTKNHWRILDTCFTDERLTMGRAMGLERHLANVDDVDIGSVVDRFLVQMMDGGDWDRDLLFRRATALLGRQRAGNGAPPSLRVMTLQNPVTEVVVPDPLAVSRTLSPETDVEMSTDLPPSLLAPRYAHLHEEMTTSSFTVAQKSTPNSRSLTSDDNTTLEHTLGTSSLPPEMRQVVRGPINTPAKKPIPRSQHPRELVRLAETRMPTKPAQFPKAQNAKDMVNLNHIEPPRSIRRPRSVSGPIFIPGNKKDSGGNVKDLVKSFEAVQKSIDAQVMRSSSRPGLRKTASAGSLHAKAIWKP